jgi:hypothetical protein
VRTALAVLPGTSACNGVCLCAGTGRTDA